MPSHPRVILHVDMDAFYAAVEVRENPALAGKPLIIGHKGPRGVVSTCSYEARPFGVRSAMPSVVAMRLCPRAIWLPGRMGLYVEVSRRVRRLFDAFTPVVEPLSIDEAFLDLTGIAADLRGGAEAARRLKETIRARERLGASVGVAPTKFLAKVASDLEKPDGLVVFPLEDVPARLWPLPVERLWGVGPKSAARLHALGLRTIVQLVETGEDRLAAALGEGSARHLLSLARGGDLRPVVADRAAESDPGEGPLPPGLRARDARASFEAAAGQGRGRAAGPGEAAPRLESAEGGLSLPAGAPSSLRVAFAVSSGTVPSPAARQFRNALSAVTCTASRICASAK